MSRGPTEKAKQGRISSCLLTAASLSTQECERYLLELGASDPELATEIRDHLAAADGLPDTFLNTPAARRLEGAVVGDDEPTSAASLPADERYELGECLGGGGMGQVFKAVDRQLGRIVALKILTRDDPSIRRYFLREGRAQARVRHDHVLEIYDSGEIKGQPFLAMRCVESGTLLEVGRDLPLEGRVRLLVQVAKGLHAAHRAGLLHRDIKPSNILVDRLPDGELQALVTDFGLARTAAGGSSAGEEMAGSPHFIAPERLDATSHTTDRRSDLYSLGVTTYQLLTGALPFAGERTLEVLRQTVRGELPRPRDLVPSLPDDLESIILRCLARDPSERYRSARAVAADLQRYLDGEVVEAYAAGLAYRVTRFVLRYRLLVAMAGIAAFALLVSSVAVAVFALRADEARRQAEQRQGQAEELIRFMLVDLRDELQSFGRLDILDKVGGAALEYFVAVPEDELSEEELLRRSRMLYQIGEVRVQQGDLEAAAEPMAQSLALARRLAQLRPDDGERLFELGQSHYWVGFVHWEQGALAAARGPFESYLEVSRRLLEIDPERPAWRQELSYASSTLGSLLQAEGDLEAALTQFLAALEIDEDLAALAPADAKVRSELAASHNTVGVVLQELGRLDEASRHLRADLEIRREMLRSDPTSPRRRQQCAVSRGHLGAHLLLRGDLDAAREHFVSMRDLLADLVRHDPDNTQWRYRLAWSHLQLGRIALRRGELEASAAAFRKQRELIDELLAIDGENQRWQRTRAVGLSYLARLQSVAGDAAAHASIRASIEILEGITRDRPSDRRLTAG